MRPTGSFRSTRERPHRWRRRATIAAALGVLVAVPAAVPGLDYLHRLGVDFLLPLRHAAFGPLFAAEDSDVVVVVIDEETYRASPFAGAPEVAWTPFLARVIEAVTAAKPRVIGLDLVYPTSLDRPGLVPGYDKALLKSFVKAGRAGRLVLGQVRLSQQVIVPYPSQIIAAGGADNLRTLNLLVDTDDVVRRYPAAFASESGARTPSFAVELAQRAGAAAPAEDFLINFNTGADDIPTFSLADLFACAEAGRNDFFERLRNRVVIFGTALDVEDRQLPAKRFAAGVPDRSAHPRCASKFDATRFGEIVARHSIPAVYIHAAAVNTRTKGAVLTLLGPEASFAAVLVSAVGLAFLFFALPPALGLVSGAGVYVAELAGSLMLFRLGTVAPVLMLAGACLITFTAVYAYRFVVEDKQRRWIQHAFRHYLAPSLVDRLAEDPSVLELGGVRRDVTVFFSDLAGFTTFSETMKDRPEQLLAILNRYLTVVSDTIESNGGYIDKFIGDAVMAIWGAPLSDASAERRAVDAALDCQAALVRFNAELAGDLPDVPALHTRMGINTGVAVVGNMGSRTRLNYTVAGDTVNLAARLEGANKVYGSLILVGETTAAALPRDYVMRCVDYLAVKGRHEPLRVFEVVGRECEVADAVVERLATFGAAFDLYQKRRFAEAREGFAQYAETDSACALYVTRCEQFVESPPGPDWDGSFKLTSK